MGAETVKTYYELLEVAPDAPVDEIKRAFRREIAKYHPDKVQHLGKEFQEIAAGRAAELTIAYKTLTNDETRAEYDATLGGGAGPPQQAPEPSAPAQAAQRPASTQSAAQPSSQFSAERSGVSVLMKRAAVERFRSAISREFGKYEEVSVPGFEIGAVPQAAFWKMAAPPRVLGRVVEVVDGRAVVEAWSLAAKMRKDMQRDLCVFLMGPALAPQGELAAAITEQRRRPLPGGGKMVLVPVNTTDWTAHVPADAPSAVKSLLARVQKN